MSADQYFRPLTGESPVMQLPIGPCCAEVRPATIILRRNSVTGPTYTVVDGVTQLPSPDWITEMVDSANSGTDYETTIIGNSAMVGYYAITTQEYLAESAPGDDPVYGTTHTYYNLGTPSDDQYPGQDDDHPFHAYSHSDGSATASKFKLSLTLDAPWLENSGSLQFVYRLLTQTYTATRAVTTSSGGTTSSITEDATQSWSDNITVDVTPDVGSTVAETPWITVPVPALGESIIVVGPNDTEYVLIEVVANEARVAAQKYGFRPYIRADSNPVPDGAPSIYRTETASRAMGTMGPETFSGTQTLASATSNPVVTFSTDVPRTLRSDPVSVIEPFTLIGFAFDHLNQAKVLDPTNSSRVIWQNGLQMDLSNEYTTTQLIADATTALDAIHLTSLEPDSSTWQGAGDTLHIAENYLSGSEANVRLMRSSYALHIIAPINPGLTAILQDHTTLIINNAAFTVTADRRTIDHDTGENQSTGSVSDTFSVEPALAGTTGNSLEYPTSALLVITDEPVPMENQLVYLTGLTVSPATVDCLDVGPKVLVIPPA